MQRRPGSVPNVILNSSRNHHQNQVFEITLDEEDEKTSVRQQRIGETKSSYAQILSKRESGITTSDNSKVSEMFVYDKENIPEKQELKNSKQTQSKSKQSLNSRISSSILNQKLNSNLSCLSEQEGILSKLEAPKNYQTNGTSELFENLDANIKEFQQLLSCNLRIIPSSDQNKNSIVQNLFSLPILKFFKENIGAQNDSKILEISRLSLKLEESKFCTEGDPSELKILRDFETKASGPRVYETKAPEVTQIQEFEESVIDIQDQEDSKFIRPFIVDSNNESYLTEPRDQRQRREFSDQPKRHLETEENDTRSQIYFLDMGPHPNRSSTPTTANKIFETFLEDYQTIISAFRKSLPHFEAKSHIVRYLATHEALGYEFLYSVMLDLKELEKSVLLADHRASTREEFLKEQIAEVMKINETFSNENIELKRKIEKLLDKNGNQSMSVLDVSKGTGGNHTKYMRGHYQALLMKTNEFYGQKIEMLKQSLLSKDKHAAIKLTIDNVFEDLAEEMGVEGVQDGLRENLKKLKELHNSIENFWTEKMEKYCLPFEKLETKSTQFLKTLDTRKTTDMNSTGPLTTRPHEILEFDRNEEDEIAEESYVSKDIAEEEENYIVKSGPETRLNSSEYCSQKSLDIILKNKEIQLNIVRRKEQAYQNLIYSLTQELRATNKNNPNDGKNLLESEKEPGHGIGIVCETQQSEIGYQTN